MVVDTLSAKEVVLDSSGDSGPGSPPLVVAKSRVSSSVGPRTPARDAVHEVPETLKDMGSLLDEYRQILVETGFDERPVYVPENEQRDQAILAEFAAMRGRVNRRVLD